MSLQVVFGEKVEELAVPAGSFRLPISGRELHVDVAYWAVGQKACSQFLQASHPDTVDDRGFVKVPGNCSCGTLLFAAFPVFQVLMGRHAMEKRKASEAAYHAYYGPVDIDVCTAILQLSCNPPATSPKSSPPSADALAI